MRPGLACQIAGDYKSRADAFKQNTTLESFKFDAYDHLERMGKKWCWRTTVSSWNSSCCQKSLGLMHALRRVYPPLGKSLGCIKLFLPGTLLSAAM
jgi:hypothetical protein